MRVQRSLDTLVLRKFGALLYVLGSQATPGTIVPTCKFGLVKTGIGEKTFYIMFFYEKKYFQLNFNCAVFLEKGSYICIHTTLLCTVFVCLPVLPIFLVNNNSLCIAILPNYFLIIIFDFSYSCTHIFCLLRVSLLSPKWKKFHEQKVFFFYILCESFSKIGPIRKKIPKFQSDPLNTVKYYSNILGKVYINLI